MKELAILVAGGAPRISSRGMAVRFLAALAVGCVPATSSSEPARTATVAPASPSDLDPIVAAPPRFVATANPAMDAFFHDDSPAPPRLVALFHDGGEDERDPCMALYELRALAPVKVDDVWEARVVTTYEPIARDFGLAALANAAAYLARGRAGDTRFVEYGVVGKGERVEHYERFVGRGSKLWRATLYVHATASAASIDAWLPRLFDQPFGTQRPKERIALFGLPSRL